MNFDLYLDLFDMENYASEIIADDWSINTCNDLDADGSLTVSDIALLVNCVENFDDINRDNQSEPCSFGLEVTNPNDTVTFSIGNINLLEQYVDIHVLNPDNEILGYQFMMGNITISSVENLVDDFDMEPSFSSDGMVLGISYQDSLIIKNFDPTPFCRVYFSSIGENVCIEDIIDVVNQDYENVIAINNTESCVQSINIASYSGINFAIYPNPADDLVAIKLISTELNNVDFSIKSLLGQTLLKQQFPDNNLYQEIDVSHLSNGIYFVELQIDNITFTEKIIIE